MTAKRIISGFCDEIENLLPTTKSHATNSLRTEVKQGLKDISAVAHQLTADERNHLFNALSALFASCSRSTRCDVCQDCAKCLGTHLKQREENPVERLISSSRPAHLTTAVPGEAPDHTRWICSECPDIKEIKTKAADQRRHLRRDHGFTNEEVRYIFLTSNGHALYQHYRPCTEAQVKLNSWRVRPFKRPSKRPRKPRTISRAI